MPVENPSWSFERTRKRSTRRDPFEAEFFSGEGGSKEEHVRSDALVREVLQNSLDARFAQSTVVVAFRFAREPLDPSRSERYLAGLVEHLGALGNEHVNPAVGIPPLTFLTVEDFGTKGLVGDPGRYEDPSPDHASDESFYWFWRNVGRSGKSGDNRGRWGLGKTVFPSSSKINAFFGLTVRGGADQRRLLMGQAITKIHNVNGDEFEPEGLYHDGSLASEIQLPIEDPAAIDRFVRDFGLTRTIQSGLSVVVPYPLDLFCPEDLVRSVLVHFFVPILRRELVVRIDTGKEHFAIDAATITDVARKIEWSGNVADKKHVPPPFEFARWAVDAQRRGDLHHTRLAGEAKAPKWDRELFDSAQLDELSKTFQAGDPVGVRAHLTIERKDGSRENSHFDVFLLKDDAPGRAEDYFVRQGMTVAKVATMAGHRGIRGLVFVDDLPLSTLLGDSEGPAHTSWKESESRPNERYKTWVSRLRFVKQSLSRVLSYFQPESQGLERDFLQEVFSIASGEKAGTTKSRGKPKKEKPAAQPEIPPLPAPKPRIFDVRRLDQPGFQVVAGPGVVELPVRVKVRAAYDLPGGNPFAKWSPFDFGFERDKKGPLTISGRGIGKLAAQRNEILFEANEADFCLQVTGFDPLRDLLLDVRLA